MNEENNTAGRQKKSKRKKSSSPKASPKAAHGSSPKASPKASPKVGSLRVKPAPKMSRKRVATENRPPTFEGKSRDPVPALPAAAQRPDASVVELPRLPIGSVVQRNPAHWTWRDQDGGPGSTGTVIADNPAKGEVTVRWAKGGKNHYRYGLHGARDVMLVLKDAAAQPDTTDAANTTFRGFSAVPGIKKLAASLGKDEVVEKVRQDISRCFNHPLALVSVDIANEAKVDSSGEEEGIMFKLDRISSEHAQEVLSNGVELPWLEDALKERRGPAYTPGSRPSVPTITPPSDLPSPAYHDPSRFAVPHLSSPASEPVAPSMPVFSSKLQEPPAGTYVQSAPAPGTQPAVQRSGSEGAGATTALVTKINVMCTLDRQSTRLLKLTLKGDTNAMPMLAIKRSLEAYTNIPTDNQLLEKDGIELQDYSIGTEVGIKPGVTLNLRLKDSARYQSIPPSVQRTFLLTESPTLPARSYVAPSLSMSPSPHPYPWQSRGVSPTRR